MRKTFFWRSIFIVCAFCIAFSLPATRPIPATAATFAADTRVAEMLAQVQPNALYAVVGSLSGEWPALVDGTPYTIFKRNTGSGEPIQKATQYVYERLQTFGLSPTFDDWSIGIISGRNIIGTLPGTTRPDEIVLLTAHVDDTTWFGGMAPGADDNASGVAGLLLAADILRGYRFERTLRFVFFTGEEWGMLGSQAYAAEVKAKGENIVAVCNLDMIAWDSRGGPVVRLHARSDSAEDLGIAGVFANVTSTYGLNLTPVIEPVIDELDSEPSDHVSFWDNGYPAILAIEDNVDDFNPYYHSSGDLLSRLNLAYFENFSKAALGTGAQLAGILGEVTGEYQAQSGPPFAVQWGSPGGAATYTFNLTNTGNLADTYQLLTTNAAWTTILPAEVGPLPAGASTQVSISVSIPPQAAGGAADTAILKIVSEGTGKAVDQVELTTVVSMNMYFPMIRR